MYNVDLKPLSPLEPHQLGLFIGAPCLLNNRVEKLTVEMICAQTVTAYPQLILTPLNRLTREQLKKLIREPQMADSLADTTLEKCKSIWGFHTLVAQHGHPDMIPWLCRHGFDVFQYISREMAHDLVNFVNEELDQVLKEAKMIE